jgi:hypothetical protein
MEPVKHFLDITNIDDVMRHHEMVCRHDRYQASLGIEQAAAYVAEAARAAGLQDVCIEYFPADGRTEWWSFKAPVSWTPTKAIFEIDDVLRIDQSTQPFAIATYSCPANTTARLANIDDANLEGAIVVIGKEAFSQKTLIDKGAIGFITDAPYVYGNRGRIELDPHSKLFAFSLTPIDLQIARAATQAKVIIEIDRSAKMPVVTGMLPGNTAKEIWLTAHLCHPRPGANDNASGVAALLGIAAAHTASRKKNASWATQQSIRFVWGPEFLGVTALLHRKKTMPAAVINLDMVGEDQSLCGGPFIVERDPCRIPSLINPLAEHIVQQVFESTGSHPGYWQPSPFMGFSDHAIFSNFAGGNIGAPAVQFCHTTDHFNHSAGDTIDKTSKVEMHRAIAAGAALAYVMSTPNVLPVETIAQQWCKKNYEQALSGNPHSNWRTRFLQHLKKQHDQMLLSLKEETLQKTNNREGPLNVRALLPKLPNEAAELIRSDKYNYSLLSRLAILSHGRTRKQTILQASFELEHPVDENLANTLLDALEHAGWTANLVLP